MKRLIAVLFLTVLFLPLNLYAQSGRKTTEQKPDKGQASKPAETSDGITDRIASPEGETIEGDVIRFDTALVTVPVTVQDRYGRYVPVLRRENFRIMEDGVEQKIAYFATSDSPFSVVLVLDTSGSTRLRLDDIQHAAINFVGKLKDSDSVMVMSFDDRINVLCDPTTDRDVITRAIRKTRTGGGTRLYDAVDEILTKQLKTMSGRKAVVLSPMEWTRRAVVRRMRVRCVWQKSPKPRFTLLITTLLVFLVWECRGRVVAELSQAGRFPDLEFRAAPAERPEITNRRLHT